MVNCDRTERQQQIDMCFTPVLVITSCKPANPDVAYRWTKCLHLELAKKMPKTLSC